MKYCSISEASARFNIPESTLRYYEKKGLLPLIERDEAGRRLFSEDQMTLLKIIIYLKNTHMPISGIKKYIDRVVEGDQTTELRLEMLKKHKQAVLAEITLMTEALEGIDVKIARYTKRVQERKNKQNRKEAP
ncbi:MULTISPECIES: MerR family transcriptional regulator [Paenibacillus]|uniref:MerR family transcriptional regulator n=1 Tax=Paenibacillus TaxID=44249 RepID=UPI001F2940C0|nr:MerR family transcriptional regulator [Paenibacillus sp. JJ-223]CAH1191240.1 putative HTH-type transcriptional regulator [Paenibacillus sp. JJ-223]